MRWPRLVVVWVTVVAALLFSACGAKDATKDTTELDHACDRWIMALGDRGFLPDDLLVSGAGGFVDVRAFGAEARNAVFDAYRRACVDVVTLEGSGITAAWMDQCVDAATPLVGPPQIPIPPACIPPPGTFADGSTCRGDYQCASLHCKGDGRSSGCGVCSPRLKEGEFCAFAGGFHQPAGSCGAGLKCRITLPNDGGRSGGSSCVAATYAYGDALEPCRWITCPADQRCDRLSILASSPLCVPRLPEGASCASPGGDQSDLCALGLTCRCETGVNCLGRTQCLVPLAPGAACTDIYECGRDAFCDFKIGKCFPARRLGEGCSPPNHPNECGWTQNTSAACVASCATGGAATCAMDPFYQADKPPGAPVEQGRCAIGHAGPCTQCPPIVDDGQPCSDTAVCGARSVCIDGICRFQQLSCP